MARSLTSGGGVDTVTDFVEGDGDAIDLSDLLAAYDPLADDLADFVRLTVEGGDTLVQVDANGAAGGSRWTTVAVLDSFTTLTTLDTLETNCTLITS